MIYLSVVLGDKTYVKPVNMNVPNFQTVLLIKDYLFGIECFVVDLRDEHNIINHVKLKPLKDMTAKTLEDLGFKAC